MRYGQPLISQVRWSSSYLQTCAGDASLYCGGPNALNLYLYNGVVPPPAGGTGALGPLTTGLPSPWTYDGCWMWVDHQQASLRLTISSVTMLSAESYHMISRQVLTTLRFSVSKNVQMLGMILRERNMHKSATAVTHWSTQRPRHLQTRTATCQFLIFFPRKLLTIVLIGLAQYVL
jgi:hypothetical protein